ncbi:hypothetical protein GOP47_0004124 [Adiantum capillus-veneris]|uniref:NAD-dependent epimerase/dehydratase domain-containing protein n=1 Tax=Adiantum capillus-veneris TaxID=13818 RepID=A0A9D4V6X5_ADICA|nr:hypothetical protein GOP47_0004124 [Adiantum capillus-veneris]
MELLRQAHPACLAAGAEAADASVGAGRGVVMVTGGAGFIGCHTVAALLARGLHDVILVDNLSSHGYSCSVKATNIKWLQTLATKSSGRLQVEQRDITDRMAMKSLFDNGVDVVCHLAARAGARESIYFPEECINTNVSGTAILLELAALSACKNFIYASSGSVYGAQTSSFAPQQQMREDSRLGQPLSPYAVSKAAAEAMAGVYHRLYKLPTTGLRFFTIYGPRGRPEMAPFKFMNLLYRGLPIEQYGDGSSWRDYTFVDDAVDGILAAIDKPHDCEIFNIGAGKPVCLSEFISTLELVMGCKATVIRKKEPKGDIVGTFADIQKSRLLLGYNPKVDLKEGLGRLYAWFQESLLN